MNKNKEIKKEETLIVKPEKRQRSPYMSKGIYNNYAKVMKEKNQKRKRQGLQAIRISTFDEWCDN